MEEKRRRRRIVEDSDDDNSPTANRSRHSPVKHQWSSSAAPETSYSSIRPKDPTIHKSNDYLPTYLGKKYFKNVFTDGPVSTPAVNSTLPTTTVSRVASPRDFRNRVSIPMQPYTSKRHSHAVDLDKTLQTFRRNVARTNRMYSFLSSDSQTRQTPMRATRPSSLHQSASVESHLSGLSASYISSFNPSKDDIAMAKHGQVTTDNAEGTFWVNKWLADKNRAEEKLERTQQEAREVSKELAYYRERSRVLEEVPDNNATRVMVLTTQLQEAESTISDLRLKARKSDTSPSTNDRQLLAKLKREVRNLQQKLKVERQKSSMLKSSSAASRATAQSAFTTAMSETRDRALVERGDTALSERHYPSSVLQLLGSSWSGNQSAHAQSKKFRHHLKRVKAAFEDILQRERTEYVAQLEKIAKAQKIKDEAQKSRQIRTILNASYKQLADPAFLAEHVVLDSPTTICVKFDGKECLPPHTAWRRADGLEDTLVDEDGFLDIRDILGTYHAHGTLHGGAQYLHEKNGIFLCLSDSKDGFWVFQKATDRNLWLPLKSDFVQKPRATSDDAVDLAPKTNATSSRWVFKAGEGIVKEDVPMPATSSRASALIQGDGDDNADSVAHPMDLTWLRGTIGGEWVLDNRISCEEVVNYSSDEENDEPTVNNGRPRPPPKIPQTPSKASPASTDRAHAKGQNHNEDITNNRKIIDELSNALAASQQRVDQGLQSIAQLKKQLETTERARNNEIKRAQQTIEKLEESNQALQMQTTVTANSRRPPPLPSIPASARTSPQLSSETPTNQRRDDLLRQAEDREKVLRQTLKETEEQLKLAEAAIEHQARRKRIASPKRRSPTRARNGNMPITPHNHSSSPPQVIDDSARVAELEAELQKNLKEMEKMRRTVDQMTADMATLRSAPTAGRQTDGSTSPQRDMDGRHYATMTSEPGNKIVRLHRPSTVGELLEKMDDIIADADAAEAARVRIGSDASDSGADRSLSPDLPTALGSGRASPTGGEGEESLLVQELRAQLAHESSKMQRLEDMIRSNTGSIIAQAQKDQEIKEERIADLEAIVADLQNKLVEAKKSTGRGKGRGRGRGRGKAQRMSAPAIQFGKPPPRGGQGGDFSMERARYERTIADLRRQLAQAGAGDSFSSPVVKLLQSLVNDGFIEANADLLAIEEQWKENFTDDDINKLLNSPEYEMLLRRYSGRPAYMRQFLESVQEVLRTFCISKTRLQQNWWKNRLKKIDFLGMDCDTMQQWATKEPWNADVSERYYYTMSRMMDQQPDKDDVTILQNKPPPKPKEDPLQRNLREAESRLDTATQRLQRAETDFHVANRKVAEARQALGLEPAAAPVRNGPGAGPPPPPPGGGGGPPPPPVFGDELKAAAGGAKSKGAAVADLFADIRNAKGKKKKKGGRKKKGLKKNGK